MLPSVWWPTSLCCLLFGVLPFTPGSFRRRSEGGGRGDGQAPRVLLTDGHMHMLDIPAAYYHGYLGDFDPRTAANRDIIEIHLCKYLMHSCLYENQSSGRFALNPPTLESFMAE